MAIVRDLSKAQLAFQIVGRDIDEFEVIRYRGTEGLCQLYRFEIDLASHEEGTTLEDIIGKPAVLSINTSQGERWFHGVIGRFEMTGETHGLSYFRAELVPSLWFLTHRYNSRIFQERSVKQIITAVLTQGGLPSDRFDMGNLSGTYDPREYCVQYRETDYNFICRLMEEEGIWWYFEQSQDKHMLMMADSTAGYKPIEGEASLPYRPVTGLNVEEEHVFRFRVSQSTRQGKVVLSDFNFENPALNLEATADNGRSPGLEFSDYPGEYSDQARGAALATIRAEEFAASRVRGIGQSNSRRISPARTFELAEHPSESFNASYLVTSALHQGKQAIHRTATGERGRTSILDARVHQSLLAAQRHETPAIRELAEGLLQVASRLGSGDPTARRELTHWLYHGGQVVRNLASTASATGSNPLEWLTIPNLVEDIAASSVVDSDAPIYECRFECIPADVTYRPPRITPWPVMRGVQTAQVTGPEGEEIYPDEYGRVKVHFPWDREGKHDENSSCWIRVSQGLAGGNYGIMFLPRIGQEVVVDFLEGDPDKPLIVGRVYNADHMPPYELPKEKTKSVIKTRSSTGGGGSNEIRFEDLKDKEQILIYGQKDIHIRAENDRVETIGANRHLTVGNDRFETIKKNYHLKVKEENLNIEVGGDQSLAVGGKVSIKVGGTHSTDVGSDVVEKFGAGHKHEVTMTYALKALAVKIEASTGIELKCGGSSIVLTPAAIFIVGGPLVNINTGAGPPVTAPTAQATAPEAPEEPTAADEVEHGRDTRYGGVGQLVEAEPEEQVAGQEAEEKETTWLEIELVDEADLPVPREPFELKRGDEIIACGILDENGHARVTGLEPGSYDIGFPRMDAEAWERA